MITRVADSPQRIFRMFVVESSQDGFDVSLLFSGQPYTPPNMAEISAAVAAFLPLSIAVTPNPVPADSITPCVVTVRTAEDVSTVPLLVGGVAVDVAVIAGVGIFEIVRSVPTLPPHIVIRAADQSVFGYATLTLQAT